MNRGGNDAAGTMRGTAQQTSASEAASFALRMAANHSTNNTFGNIFTSDRQQQQQQNLLLLSAALAPQTSARSTTASGDALRLLQSLERQQQQQQEQQATEARIARLAASNSSTDTGSDLVLQQLLRLYQQQQQGSAQQGLSCLLGGSSTSTSSSSGLDSQRFGLRASAAAGTSHHLHQQLSQQLQQHLSGSSFGQAQRAQSLAPPPSVFDIARAMNESAAAVAASTNQATVGGLTALVRESAERGHLAGLSSADIATTRAELIRQFRLHQVQNTSTATAVSAAGTTERKPPQQASVGGYSGSESFRGATSALFQRPPSINGTSDQFLLDLIDGKPGTPLSPDDLSNGAVMNANNNNDVCSDTTNMKRKAEGPPEHVVVRDLLCATSAAAHPKATTKPLAIAKKKRRVINNRLSNIQEKEIPHFSRRSRAPLGIDEDQNWLSEFQCFARAEMMEVFQASETDVVIRSTSKSVKLNQVGVRCRFCAHLPHGDRVNRSSAFPSRLDKLYQSFNMMVRDHFAHCKEIPKEIWDQYLALKAQNSQGACDSRHYWYYAAQKLGMVDTIKPDDGSKKGGAAGHGIEMSESTQAAGQKMPPYGSIATEAGESGETEGAQDGALSSPPPSEDLALVRIPDDKDKASPFLYELLSHIQMVRLIPPERVGKRKTLPLGLEGIGCRYCYKVGRLGFSRCYPLRRRGLPAQIYDMHNHLQRCTVCPKSVKDGLRQLLGDQKKKSSPGTIDDDKRGANSGVDPAEEAEYMEIIWSRLGRTADLTTS